MPSSCRSPFTVGVQSKRTSRVCPPLTTVKVCGPGRVSTSRTPSQPATSRPPTRVVSGMSCPSMAVITSPVRRPRVCAVDPATTSSMRARSGAGTPCAVNVTVIRAMASSRFVSGPASRIATFPQAGRPAKPRVGCR